MADFIKRPSVSQRIFKSVHPNQWLDEETSIEVLNNSDRMFELKKWVDKVVKDGKAQARIQISYSNFQFSQLHTCITYEKLTTFL